MAIFIHKNDEQLGPYQETEIKVFIQEGRITLENLGWKEGMSDWKPLKEIINSKTTHPSKPSKNNFLKSKKSLVLGLSCSFLAITVCIFGVCCLLNSAGGRDTSSVEKALLGHWTLESSMYIGSFPDSKKTHLYFDKASLIVVPSGKPPVNQTYKVVVANNNCITLEFSEKPGKYEKYIFSSDQKFMTNPISFLGREMSAVYKYVDSKLAP